MDAIEWRLFIQFSTTRSLPSHNKVGVVFLHTSARPHINTCKYTLHKAYTIEFCDLSKHIFALFVLFGESTTSCKEKIQTLTRPRYSRDDDNYEVDNNGDVEIPMSFHWTYIQSHAYII